MSLSVYPRGNSLKIVTSKTVFNSCNVKGRELLCEDRCRISGCVDGLSLEIQKARYANETDLMHHFCMFLCIIFK